MATENPKNTWLPALKGTNNFDSSAQKVFTRLIKGQGPGLLVLHGPPIVANKTYFLNVVDAFQKGVPDEVSNFFSPELWRLLKELKPGSYQCINVVKDYCVPQNTPSYSIPLMTAVPMALANAARAGDMAKECHLVIICDDLEKFALHNKQSNEQFLLEFGKALDDQGGITFLGASRRFQDDPKSWDPDILGSQHILNMGWLGAVSKAETPQCVTLQQYAKEQQQVTPGQLEILKTLAAAKKFGWGLAHAEQVNRLSNKIYKEMVRVGLLEKGNSSEQVLQAASFLHDTGRPKEPHNLVAFQELALEIPKVLKAQPLPASELSAILYCILFHRGHDFSERPEMPLVEPERTKRLAAILRIADGLDHGPPFDKQVKNIVLGLSGDTLVCQVEPTSKAVTETVKGYCHHTEHEKVDLFKAMFKKTLLFEVLNPYHKLTGERTNVERLNFSWLINKEVAGHGAPSSEDDLIYLKDKGIKALVRMAETDKVQVTAAQIEKLGFSDCHEPVADFTAPKQSQIDRMVRFIETCVVQKSPVGVSCTAGIGRTGTILACYLVKKGRSADEAMDEVKAKRGAGIETQDQKAAVRAYAKRISGVS